MVPYHKLSTCHRVAVFNARPTVLLTVSRAWRGVKRGALPKSTRYILTD
jgi:hypothetical protein